MARGFFVTGTDTGVGKTLAASALLHAFGARGLATAGMKPVASGAHATPDGLRNDDALALMAAATVALPYEVVNPYCFEPAIAPHIAAADVGVRIDLGALIMNYLQVVSQCDVAVVEGAGGWLAPLDEEAPFAAIPAVLSLDVILVVGLRLGCLNHALMTAESIERYGSRAVAWIGSVIDPGMARLDDNVATLRSRLAMPCLGIVPHLADATAAAAAHFLDLSPLRLDLRGGPA